MSDIDVKLKHVSHALYHIPCGVMVSVLALSAVYRGFEPRSDQTIDYTIGICCFFAKQGEKSKTGWFGISIMCPSGATCPSAVCCFSGLAL